MFKCLQEKLFNWTGSQSNIYKALFPCYNKMVKKKRVPARKVSRKRSVGKNKKMIRSTSKKINLVFKNLIFFAILFVLSRILYAVSGSETYENLFLLLSIVFGFVGVAFLIVLLIFLFLKIMKK